MTENPLNPPPALTRFDARFAALLAMKREDAPEVDNTVAAIIADLRARGDAALIELAQQQGVPAIDLIGPLLRHIRPSGAVGAVLMWEGIVIDPIGALLAAADTAAKE